MKFRRRYGNIGTIDIAVVVLCCAALIGCGGGTGSGFSLFPPRHFPFFITTNATFKILEKRSEDRKKKCEEKKQEGGKKKKGEKKLRERRKKENEKERGTLKIEESKKVRN